MRDMSPGRARRALHSWLTGACATGMVVPAHSHDAGRPSHLSRLAAL
jgi:hypothetical protein